MTTGWSIFTKRNALLMLTPFFTTFSHAQENPIAAGLVADAGQLETVTVTATRTERNVDDVPSSVSVTGEQDINRTLSGGIDDLIRYEPGISVPRSVTRFGNSGFNIRGIEGNRVLIQIDGIRIPDTFSIGSFSNATRDLVDLDALKRVEILRGPSSSLYGSDAIGGAVSYFTKDPADYLTNDGLPFHIGLKAGYASADDSRRGGITLAGRVGEVEGLILYSRREGHEQETKGDDNSASLTRTTANPQDREGENVLGKIVVRPNSSNAIKLTAEQFRDDTRTDVLSTIGLVTGTRTTTGLTGDDESERTRFSLEHEYRGGAGAGLKSVRWQLYDQRGEVTQRTEETQFNSAGAGSNRLRVRDFTFEQSTTGASVQLDHVFALGPSLHEFIYGFEAAKTNTSEQRDGTEFNLTAGTSSKTVPPDTFPVRDFPNSDTHTAAIFAQDEIALLEGSLSLIPGLRYDYYRLKPDADDTFAADNPGVNVEELKETAFSPKFGVVYRFTDFLSMYGQYAEGFRAPPYNDINIGFTNLAFGYTAIPNPNLKAEKSRGFEIGVRKRGETLALNFAIFDNRYRDFIESLSQLDCPSDPRCSTVVPITFQSVNLDRVRIYGAEAGATWKFASKWSLRASAAYAHGRNEKTNQPLNSVDPTQVVLGVRHNDPAERYGGEVIATLVNKKTGVDNSTGKLFKAPGFALLDFLAWYNFGKHASLNAGIFNVLDKKYWRWSDVRGQLASSTTLDRYTQPGRNFSVSFRYQF